MSKKCSRCKEILPLKNNIICGLHVSWNLQILTKMENLIKSNKLEIK